MIFSYNGDVSSAKDCFKIKDTFKDADVVMIGRGIIAKPRLAAEIKALEENAPKEKTDELSNPRVFKAFNHELIDGYNEIMPGEKNTLSRLKELWTYMIHSFDDGKKLLKSIKRAGSVMEYARIIDSL